MSTTQEASESSVIHLHYLALAQAASVIRQMDARLSQDGKGLNLSAVPGFEGVDFSEALDAMASRLHAESDPAPRDYSDADGVETMVTVDSFWR